MARPLNPTQTTSKYRKQTLNATAGQKIYFARARIFLRLRWRRRVRFFFHFQRIFDVDFL